MNHGVYAYTLTGGGQVGTSWCPQPKPKKVKSRFLGQVSHVSAGRPMAHFMWGTPNLRWFR